ncbi:MULTISPECIES: hemerythrin domain-containing protein [Kitasatospora]|uniref:Hemerythrin domain-containing protein n=1 Tax=Kitasatospora cathayae TaxID=3004092 RepID=A0ABY7PVU6_9ACTN|nr:hemerythrin domain-containing protein [Kitasatospora sp. HUAS 3-15]WBP84481.1 hemerythrin domain-containing protein [Kitasatospora sp. HUAS 3-15]
MQHDEDLLDQLTADHQAVLVHFSELSGLPSGDPQRKELADQVTDQLVRHTRAEEQHLYPLARDRLTDGPAVVERELADHGAVEALLGELRPTRADGPSFDRLVARLAEEVTRHAAEEEHRLFPAVRAVTTEAELRLLAARARETKARSSGRPRHQPPTKRPADRLPPPERPLMERLREFLTPGGPR